jgi:LacI family transcriptional regulator
MKNAPTISDVARKAGVSVATVSRVMNGTKFVSAQLRERVQLAMRELDYQPNLLAGSLRRQESFTVGLIVPDTSNAFFGELAKGVEDAGFENDYNVILCNSDYNLERERTYVEVLQAKQVDGLIFIPSSAEMEHVKALLERMRGPVITVDRLTPELDADSITVDNRQGGRLAAQHLVDLGHERIGCVGRPKYLAHVEERISGFCEVLKERGIELHDAYRVQGGFSFAEGVEAGKKILALPRPPTAIFAYNDVMAIGVLRAARELDVRVPEDLAIVGFDNIPVASFVTPQLTTVNQPKYEIGAQAAQLLIDRLNLEREGPPERRVLDVDLVVRESSAVEGRDGIEEGA